MLDRHREILDRMTARYAADPDVLALVVIGSVARGDAHERSDVDAFAIVGDEAATGGAPLSAAALSGESGDPAAARVWAKGTLRAAAERGPEPTRYAFADTIVPFARDPEIAPLLAKIPLYPEAERDAKLASFASQLPMHLSYLYLGDDGENPYLLVDTANELALFGGRLILAHNRLLYPGRKRFLQHLEWAPEQPERFMWLLRRLLRQPAIPTAEAFCDAVLTFQEWPQPSEGQGARYLHDRDEAWLWRPVALAEG